MSLGKGKGPLDGWRCLSARLPVLSRQFTHQHLLEEKRKMERRIGPAISANKGDKAQSVESLDRSLGSVLDGQIRTCQLPLRRSVSE